MARDILSEYGPSAHKPQAARASGGGAQTARDVHNYSPPKGPSNIGDSKSPGLHGTNHGVCGTQGTHGTKGSESGSPGLHGSNHGMGTNRKG